MQKLCEINALIFYNLFNLLIEKLILYNICVIRDIYIIYIIYTIYIIYIIYIDYAKCAINI